jgi:hypothetical protein
MTDAELTKALVAIALSKGFVILELPPTVTLQRAGNTRYRLARVGISTEKECNECRQTKKLIEQNWRRKTGKDAKGWQQPCRACQKATPAKMLRRLEQHLKAEGLI